MNGKATTFTIKPIYRTAQLQPLLSACGLPVSDISDSASSQFFGAFSEEDLIGSVGLDLYAPVALLRSLAVSSAHRGHGLGEALVAFAERRAAMQGITSLYLLTTSAAPFFSKRGYTAAARTDAPATIRTSAQFSGLCPASSTFMVKQRIA